MSAADTSSQLRTWLQMGAWNALRAHFTVTQPVTALDYHARALLLLNHPYGNIDWNLAISDLRRACELDPRDASAWANLSQALLDSGRPEESYDAAVRAHDLAPSAPLVIEKFALSAARTCRWNDALIVLQDLRSGACASGWQLSESARVLLQQLSARWWVPIWSSGLTMRRPIETHRAFLVSAFNDASFIRHYNRFQRGSDDAIQSYLAQAQLSPYQTRRLDWIVEDRLGHSLGFGAIVDIDWTNLRGEFVLGFPSPPPATVALKVSIAILDFAFARLGLQKLLSYVYSDNPQAQANTLHLGFVQEGLLREHVGAFDRTGRTDLYVNGMLAREFLSNERLRRMRDKWLEKTPPA